MKSKLTKKQKEYVEYILDIRHWMEWSNDRNIAPFDIFKKSFDYLLVFELNKDKYDEYLANH